MAVKKRSRQELRAIVREAKKRFKRCEDWEAVFRPRYLDDIKFVEGDAYNMYQWPAEVQDRLKADNRVMLTINRARQHVLDILNDARQTRIALKVRPIRSGASFEAAQAWAGIFRHIEYQSNADTAYQHALSGAVRGGIGWFRLVTDFVGDDSFDQDAFIRRVPDPMSVYLDPDIVEFDGSDAKFGFVFTDMDRDEYDKMHPGKTQKGKEGSVTTSGTFGPKESWVGINKVRVSEYFRVVHDEDKLLGFTHPQTGEPMVVRQSEARRNPELKALMDVVIDDPRTMSRSIPMPKVEHFEIVGDEIVDEKEWLGRYVPLIRTVGEEVVIDGEMDRKGHVRWLLDQQRMANYNASASVEYGALQSKVPWIVALAAIDASIENVWKNANVSNPSYLPYNHIDDDGNSIPAPTRTPPPQGAPVFENGFKIAIEQMFLASGQNQADFGMPSNEKSGVAIQQRQRQGDNATYHYIDHQRSSIILLGKMLLDLLPKLYDTERTIMTRDEAGKESEVTINPNAPQPYQTEKVGEDQERAVLNPRLGVFDVQADTGPAYATQRQEAFDAYTQILTQNKDLTHLIGDIALRFADFPGAEEAAARLRRMVPKQALEDGPAPDVLALQGQVQAMQQLVGDLNAKLADKMADHINDQEKNAVSGYDAQTRRLAALKDALPLDPQDLLNLVREVLTEAQQTSGALGPALDGTPPVEPTAPPPPQPEMPPQGPGPGGPGMAPPGPEGGPAEMASPGGPPLG